MILVLLRSPRAEEPYGTVMKHRVIASDNVGNYAIKEDAGAYFFQIIPDFPVWETAAVTAIVAVSTILMITRKIRSRKAVQTIIVWCASRALLAGPIP
jgi:hypothetical protein